MNVIFTSPNLKPFYEIMVKGNYVIFISFNINGVGVIRKLKTWVTTLHRVH